VGTYELHILHMMFCRLLNQGQNHRASRVPCVCAWRQVTLSSLNRHAVATYADVGLPKATVMADRLKVRDYCGC
jgi:hypothetical protein